jgi:Ca2+-binding RTX toxin-like protein
MAIDASLQRSRRAALLCLVIAAYAAVAFDAGLAEAATVSRIGSTIVYAAGQGETNRVAVYLDDDYWISYGGWSLPAGRAYVFRDSGGVLAGGDGCTRAPIEAEVFCPASAITELVLSTGDRDDSVDVLAPTRARIDGGSGADRLAGGLGDDVLDGGPGSDELSGGGGTDWVTYHAREAGVTVAIDDVAADGVPGEGDNVRTDVEDVTGTRYADALTGSAAANRLYGAEGDDTLRGGLGGDALSGEAGADWLSGEAGDDLLLGSYGDDRLLGGDGDDQLLGGPGGLADGDEISGGTGIDWVSYTDRPSAVRVSLDGVADDGKPSDHERPSEHDNVWPDVEDVTGTRFGDVLTGGAGPNALFGLEGDDTLRGGAGPDRLTGHGGADVLYGEGDNDVLLGLDGGDRLFGGDGNDTIGGGPGGPADADDVSGGGGVDWVSYYGRATGVTVTLDDAAGDGEPGEGDNVRSDVEDLTGTSFVDVLVGSASANALFGAEGDDTLTGGPGVDRLLGEAGDDTLFARDGVADRTVDGGAGTDRADLDAVDFRGSVEVFL